ncbi:hypothetical protein SAMN05444320_10272 [Streptoalloteichus hindustanus]|uniref:Uncharacterized protein n=1 Tax=Streptoalloteichus hindustanus TaxID=2017 RepID=A0A1M4XPI3_STRHI|nr:hypothetical protein SAMN05444320_10272 [Streptoalloteichus hindustanus]
MIPPRRHLVQYYLIESGCRVLRGRESLDDDWFYFCRGGPEVYARALIREFFVREPDLVAPGQRWLVTVHVAASKPGGKARRLCEVEVRLSTPDDGGSPEQGVA